MEAVPSSDTPESTPGLSTISISSPQPAPSKVLIVDDDDGLRLLLRLALADEPYTIYEAATGEIALRMCCEIQPELILLDIALSEMDGITVLQRVRAVNQSVCILMVSALNMQKWIFAAMTHGADGFIAKPLNVTTLRQTVAKHLKGSHPQSGI